MYQPGWTLAAGGVKNPDSFRREESKMIPKGVEWIKAKASIFEPESNSITLENGEKVKYEYLVMATGIRIDFDGVKIYLYCYYLYNRKLIFYKGKRLERSDG